ncbi:hypothetical protein SOVF_043990 [Spinacia oleracea]|nr:hypothetical protein SOVF_043990 [Spinacia oleracea]
MSGIMENAVGGLIASETHGILARLLSRISEEIKLGLSFNRELQQLETQLTTLSLLLQSTSFQSNNNNLLLVNWLNKVNNIAYDADDLLDECSYEALKQSTLTRKAKHKLKDRVSFPFSRHFMARRVREMRKLIESVYCDAKKLGVKPIKVVNGDNSSEIEDGKIQQNRRKWVDDQFLVGRDDDITRIMELLCHPSNNTRDLTVVGIVGLAGLGKTALSKRVSKAKQVMECFNSHVIWLVVSYTFDQTDILKKMVQLLYKEASNLCALQEIGGSKGTSMLVTSRAKNVVAKMDTYGEIALQKAAIYQIKGLNEYDSWSLLVARMRGDDNLVAASGEGYVIAKRMMKKCGGVPLAIRALGDLLRDQSIKKWREIEESDVWGKEDKLGILPSLKLSFHYLPNMGLKRCFSYCAIFKEDEVIEGEKLIQLWMAQGFLQHSDKMELIGKEYLYILLNSSFFQEAEFDEFGSVETFKIHDLVLSLARVVATDLELLNLGEKKIHDDRSTTATFCKKFRTYYYSQQSFYQRLYKSLKFISLSKNLRVLCLCNLGLKELPESVSCLKHLRYLDISGNEFVTLPKVITKLYHLQTLRVLSNGTLYGSKHFPIVTKEVGNLVNLRHICAGKYQEIGIPVGLGRLSALQTIPTIDLREDWGGRLSELGSLSKLKGTLKIQGLECVNGVEEAQTLNLRRLLSVDRLILKWSITLGKSSSSSYHMNEILEVLQPHENLSTLEVSFYGGTILPFWFTLYNLVSLKLNHFTHAEGNLTLENLPSLRFLSVKNCYWLSITFPIHGFNSYCRHLEELIIDGSNIDNLPDLSPLTHLRVLVLASCQGGSNRRRNNRIELTGLASLTRLTTLYTDELLPADLCKNSPVCSSLLRMDLACTEFLCDDSSLCSSLPQQIQHLVGLQSLGISEFECLELLPDWLGKLTCLKTLRLVSLPKLKRLPCQDVMQRLRSLQYLQVRGCPLLEEQLSSKNGELFKTTRLLDVNWLNTQREASSSVERSFVQGIFNVISENNIRFSI